jgi:sporulation protein YqfC
MAKQDSRQDLVLNSSSDIPFSAMGNNLHIEMFGSKRLSIDGIFTIAEYTEENVKLKFKKGFLEIFGVNLTINNVNDENLLITGKIISIEFDE